MISVYAIESIIPDLKDIIRLGNIPEEVATALQYNVLNKLEYEIENSREWNKESLIQYLETAADGEIEIDIDKIDADYWVGEIEEYSFNDDATWEPSKDALQELIKQGHVRYVEKPDEMEDLV